MGFLGAPLTKWDCITLQLPNGRRQQYLRGAHSSAARAAALAHSGSRPSAVSPPATPPWARPRAAPCSPTAAPPPRTAATGDYISRRASRGRAVPCAERRGELSAGEAVGKCRSERRRSACPGPPALAAASACAGDCGPRRPMPPAVAAPAAGTRLWQGSARPGPFVEAGAARGTAAAPGDPARAEGEPSAGGPGPGVPHGQMAGPGAGAAGRGFERLWPPLSSPGPGSGGGVTFGAPWGTGRARLPRWEQEKPCCNARDTRVHQVV